MVLPYWEQEDYDGSHVYMLASLEVVFSVVDTTATKEGYRME